MYIDKFTMQEIIKRNINKNGSWDEEEGVFEIQDPDNCSVDHIADDIIYEMRNMFSDRKNMIAVFSDEYEYDGRDIHDCVDRIKIKIAYYNLEYKVYPGEILFVKDLTDMSINKYRCTKIDEDYVYLKEDIE